MTTNEKNEEVMTNLEELTPSEYFEYVKSKKNTITDKDLQGYYSNCLELINKYNITGQTNGMRKLIFHLQSIEKERELVKMGITTFIYREDIEHYIDKIAHDTVKVIELERYEREIPDEVVEVIAKVKNLFDQLYVLFTDYTGETEQQLIREKRLEVSKDPILFGTFIDRSSRGISNRFYFLADWVDEYCDLTLNKLVNEVKAKESRNVAITISTPKDIEALKKQLSDLEATGNGSFRINPEKSKNDNLFKRISTFFKGDKK